MKKILISIISLLCAVLLVMMLTSCGKDEESTITGIVTSIDGGKVTIMEMNLSSVREGGFDPGEFGGTMTGDFDGDRPEMPEGFDLDNFDPSQMPEMPDGFDTGDFDPSQRPERPDGLDTGDFDPKDFDGERPNMSDFGDGETQTIDISNAHISIEDNGEKASGTIDDVTVGSSITVTLNGKGEATNVSVTSSRRGFKGGMPNFSGNGEEM